MTVGLSLYLDVFRFFMAAVVVIGHSTFNAYTGKGYLFWFAFPYMQTAVMGFFVLSGFVIAHAMQKENTLRAYASARIARLYSVVVPALLLTLVADKVGQALDPAFYAAGPVVVGDGQPARYLASFLLINNFWLFANEMIPGSNGPFWSLSYEMVYYVIAGLFLLPNMIWAVLGTILVSLLAGPHILALYPLWLLGFGLYFVHRKIRIPSLLAAVLFVGTVVVAIKVGWLRVGWDYAAARPLHLDYVEGVLIALNILAASSLSGLFATALGWCAPLVRWLGSLTFAMYLCHRPLLHVLTVLRIDAPGTWQQHVWLFGGTFAIVVVVASLGEWLRRAIRVRLAAAPIPAVA